MQAAALAIALGHASPAGRARLPPQSTFASMPLEQPHAELGFFPGASQGSIKFQALNSMHDTCSPAKGPHVQPAKIP